MTTIETQRAAAARRYAQAAAELIASAVELAACDAAISNAHVAGEPLRTFAGLPAVLPHPLALPDPALLHRDLGGRIAARRDQLVAEATAG